MSLVDDVFLQQSLDDHHFEEVRRLHIFVLQILFERLDLDHEMITGMGQRHRLLVLDVALNVIGDEAQATSRRTVVRFVIVCGYLGNRHDDSGYRRRNNFRTDGREFRWILRCNDFVSLDLHHLRFDGLHNHWRRFHNAFANDLRQFFFDHVAIQTQIDFVASFVFGVDTVRLP